MNFYQDELTAQYNRQRVKEEFELIRMEQHTARLHVFRSSPFKRIMHGVASWMIRTGKELHARYEIPTPHHHTTPSSSFAR